jgi:prolipoprotein diacylglyceryltransferase
MTIAIDPHIFGSPLLTWVGLSTMAGAVVAIALAVRRGPELGLTRRAAYGVALRAVLWAYAGARLVHVVDLAGFYASAPFQIFYLWNGGFALWGAILAGAAGAAWHARRAGASVGRYAQGLPVWGLVAMSIGRAGDLLAGERAGEPTSLPWGITYANTSAQAYAGGAAVHPVALYELVLDLGLAAALVWLLPRLRHSGRTGMLAARGSRLGLGLAAYAAGRFAIEFAVAGETLAGLRGAQWIAMAVVAGVAWSAWRGMRGHGRAVPKAPWRGDRSDVPRGRGRMIR